MKVDDERTGDLTWRPQFRQALRFLDLWSLAAAAVAAGLLMLLLVPLIGQLLVVTSMAYFIARVVVLRWFPHPFLPRSGIVGHEVAIVPVKAKTLRSYLNLYDAEHQRVNHWTRALSDYHTKLIEYPFSWPRALAFHAAIVPAERSQRDQVLGSLSISPTVRSAGVQVTIGAFMAAEHRGRGLFTEALRLGLGTTDELAITPVYLMCDLDNIAMMKSATKAGMTRIEGIDYRHPDQTISRAAVFVHAATPSRCSEDGGTEDGGDKRSKVEGPRVEGNSREDPVEGAQPLTWERD